MTLDDACSALPLVRLAREIAAVAHASQRYGNLPYTWHLEQVAGVVLESRDVIGDNWAHALADAFLHDVIEDVDGGEALLLGKMPDDVIADVRSLTKRVGLSAEAYYAGIRAAGRNAVATKIADRIANLTACQSPDSPSPKKLAKYRGERSAFARMHVPGELDAMWAQLNALYDRD